MSERVGYIRVSSYSQNHERQLDGIERQRTYIDSAIPAQHTRFKAGFDAMCEFWPI